MARLSCLLTYVVLAVAALTSPACAGIPRGLMLIGDEQAGDETTGVTIARGHAELVVEKQPIHAIADVIELHPKTNEILFKGRASLAVAAWLGFWFGQTRRPPFQRAGFSYRLSQTRYPGCFETISPARDYRNLVHRPLRFDFDFHRRGACSEPAG